MTTDDGTDPAPGAVPEPSAVLGDVVVAVGEDDAGGSVRFAAAEATARGVGVHLVHVVRMPAVNAVSTAVVRRFAVAHGRALLSRAAEQIRATGFLLEISTRLVERGPLVPALAADGERAGAIVVQHRRLGTLQRLTTWSVSNALGARSDAPVIVVPADWAAGPERVGCVVVGLQDLSDLEHVLPDALDEADRRGLPLRVVHAGRLSAQAGAAMVAAIERVRDERPDVTIRRVFEDRDPVELLVGAITTAELVVIGRRRHGLPRRSQLGPVARGVLDRSDFPVLLVPPAGTDRARRPLPSETVSEVRP